jgi:Domain of unknown function (DUF5615)
LFFLVDAQLPPSLAEALRQAGFQAIHVVDLGLQAATDEEIWDKAVSRRFSSPGIATLRFAAPQRMMVQQSCGSELATQAIEG